MFGMLVSLALAVAVFAWILAPLFGPPSPIAESRGSEELSAAVDRSLRELRTDLELGKIQEEDLAAIQEHLTQESGG
jgi:hypothetical protein